MNPQCARCNKTVYPMEKLNCLDKYWHKGCFNCETCNMKLTMKNYKGYNKKPYCNAHYPTTKFTAVADTPENLRLKKNTTQQSNVVYHKEFETAKGQYTAVTDDPETQRLKKVTNMSSQVAYKSAVSAPGGSQPGGAGRLTPQQQQQQQRKYDDYLAEPPSQYEEEFQEQPDPPPSMPAMPPQMAPDPRAAPPMPSSGGPLYVAMYDYAAADDDEVSFVEGDIIVNTEEIDAGWMSGTVQRTGDTGMLPSNYVQPS